MESKDHISESVKEEVRKAMDDARETMGEHKFDLPPHMVGLSKAYQKFFLEHFEEYATKIYLKIEEMTKQELVEKTNSENDGLENTQPQKTHGANVVHPTWATSTIEDSEDVSKSRREPEISEEVATIEQQRSVTEAKMNEDMLTPNTEQPDSDQSLKNRTLDKEMINPQAKHSDSHRSLKRPRSDEEIDDDPKLSSQMHHTRP